MRELIFVIGGCKSGKSNYALSLAEKISTRRIFLATCIPFDDEMKERVARHKQRRDDSWQTFDVPTSLPETLKKISEKGSVVLVDCLTLWLNNLLLTNEDPQFIQSNVAMLVEAASSVPCSVLIVSNEVGAGIVPENRLARLFRDVAGTANQRIAAAADRVILMTAGLPLTLKGKAP